MFLLENQMNASNVRPFQTRNGRQFAFPEWDLCTWQQNAADTCNVRSIRWFPAMPDQSPGQTGVYPDRLASPVKETAVFADDAVLALSRTGKFRPWYRVRCCSTQQRPVEWQ